MKINVEKTKKGLPALWEEGGGYSNTGEAQIICGPQGEPLSPIYIRKKGPLANSKHALFLIRPGYYVIRAYHHRRDFDIDVLRIENVDVDGEEAEVALVCQFDQGEWDSSLPSFLSAAVEAAKEKAVCYHCREPHFVAPDGE
ncbi:hypothetical protein [Atrimonas thermophila]|uniref:hypothetical protein n=1 Tax=Atrimonas thermophila TaxID=3064161 RepID=UPI00399CEFAD